MKGAMDMAKPLVAIVGRPNVGKSMLFNKLTGQRTSIVEDTPGVTRDRIYGDCEWCNRHFSLVDTGGIEPGTDSDMLKFMRRQAEIGIELADAIIMVTDVRSGVTAADQDVATMLRKSGKPVCLAVNKCDSVGLVNPDVYEFYSLGIGDLFETSAVHGHGTGDMLDWVLENIPAEDEDEEESDIIKVAIVGKPNVGKSSLLNRILGEERVIVSNVAGTTRDAIDSYFENESGKYCFIDTAGMRRKSKVDDAIERYSNMRSINAIERADVCLILVDANEGVTEQDTKIAGLVHEAGKAAIIVVNKWDAVEDKETNTMRDMEGEVRNGLSYMLYAPVVFLSALTGQRVDKLFQVIQDVHTQNTSRITTGALNSVLADATARVQPPTDKGRRLKIYYMTQASTKPPHFVIFCNDARLFHFSYQRYLENQIREVFGLKGTPVRITIRQKGDKEEV
jgi:GTP-binding protein